MRRGCSNVDGAPDARCGVGLGRHVLGDYPAGVSPFVLPSARVAAMGNPRAAVGFIDNLRSVDVAPRSARAWNVGRRGAGALVVISQFNGISLVPDAEAWNVRESQRKGALDRRGVAHSNGTVSPDGGRASPVGQPDQRQLRVASMGSAQDGRGWAGPARSVVAMARLWDGFPEAHSNRIRSEGNPSRAGDTASPDIIKPRRGAWLAS
jgi:hypothetical protein